MVKIDIIQNFTFLYFLFYFEKFSISVLHFSINKFILKKFKEKLYSLKEKRKTISL